MFGYLKRAGVLGMNARNADFVMRYNRRQLYPLVDDKLLTKKKAREYGVPVPELYGYLSAPHDIRELPKIVADHPAFVVKPARGSGGDGILVFDSHRNDRYWTVSGRILAWSELEHHLANTLNGQYSLGGLPDEVMIEYRVRFHPLFDAVSFQGVPDIRIIVFQGYPVMAMARLPTRASQGKANLHQGAVGVGIGVATGTTLNGVIGNDSIREHPDTGVPVIGIQVPDWDQMLLMAARSYELTGLGYLGVDIVMDATRGPLLLELNARPGLNIQIANAEGLMPRLREIERIVEPGLTPAERVAVSQATFGAKA
jgi:alpha-L-glutamate ligase-like protein